MSVANSRAVQVLYISIIIKFKYSSEWKGRSANKDMQEVENVQSENDGLQEPGVSETSYENGNLKRFNIYIIILSFRIKKNK